MQAVFPIDRLRTIWEQIVFRAAPPLTKSDFVGNVTDVYQNDTYAFEKEIRAAYQSFFPVLDVNMNCRLEKEEFIVGLKVFGHNDKIADLNYFNQFINKDGVLVIDLVHAWVQFHTNGTDVDNSAVKDIDKL